MKEFLQRVRRASRRSPRYLAARLVEAGRARFRRPWTRIYPHLLTEQGVVRAAGAASIDAYWTRLQRAAFFVNTAERAQTTEAFRARYPDAAAAIVDAADRVLRHEFDLLGSGCVTLGPTLPWHRDFKTGREWPLQYRPTSTTRSSIARPT